MVFWLDRIGDTALADTVMECAEPPAGMCIFMFMYIAGTLCDIVSTDSWSRENRLTLYTLVHFIAQYAHYVNAHAFPYMACNAATAR